MLPLETSSDSEWMLNKNSEKLLGVEFQGKFTGSSLLHLIARKNKFPAKEDQKI
jgi:hypothetical protein